MLEIINVEQQHIASTNFNPVEADNFKSSTNNSICFKYIEYILNKNATTFEELFDRKLDQNENDVDNSCYVNLIVNTYNKCIRSKFNMEGRQGDSNRKKLLTAQKICEICGITYKESDIGLSVKKSIRFFEEYHVG